MCTYKLCKEGCLFLDLFTNVMPNRVSYKVAGKKCTFSPNPQCSLFKEQRLLYITKLISQQILQKTYTFNKETYIRNVCFCILKREHLSSDAG